MTEKDSKRTSEYEKTFQQYDQSGCCLVSLDILPKMLQDLNIQPNKAIMDLELPKIKNETNLISISQFCKLCSQLEHLDLLKQKFEKFMQRFDSNGNCLIEGDELKEAMEYIGERMTDEQIKEMMDAFDLDKDGSISLDDFCKAMQM